MKTKNKKTNTAPAQEEEKEGKKRWLLLLLLLLLFLLLLGTSFLLWRSRGGNDTPISGDTSTSDGTLTSGSASTSDDTRIPPKSETGAESIAGDDTDTKLNAPEGGGAVSLTYSKKVEINLGAKKASLMFANPSKSTQDAVVQLVIRDTVILQSGSLTPGTQVTALDLAEGAEAKLSAGLYDGRFVVSFYDRSTDRWAMLNAEIPVTVTVTN